MLTKTEINKIDSHQMYQIYDSWHDSISPKILQTDTPWR